MHKGFWYHGKSREYASMVLFGRFITPGSVVAEVGGHIGFVSLYFSELTGTAGRVFVFEPGSNNLPYCRVNVAALANVQLVEAAVGDADGEATLFEESLTGQNNSLVRDFGGLQANHASAYVGVEVCEKRVPIVRLDSYLREYVVDFIKIDVEGHELKVLQGARRLLERCAPAVMVEVQADEALIFHILSGLGYRLFNDRLAELRDPASLRGNVFALHRDRHADLVGGGGST